MATSVWLNFRGCSHSLMFKPVDLLATQVAPTAANISFFAEQPWLLHPNTSRFVTSPCPGYANRPIRATDGKRTCTSQDSQPCRLFLDRFLHIPQVEVCFLRLPPGFPGGATIFQPCIRWPRTLTEPDLQISCIRLFKQVHSLSADSRVGFGDNVFPGFVSRIVSPPRYT